MRQAKRVQAYLAHATRDRKEQEINVYGRAKNGHDLDSEESTIKRNKTKGTDNPPYKQGERHRALKRQPLNPLSESKYKTMPPATAPQAKTPLRRNKATLNNTIDSERKSASPVPIEPKSTSKLTERRHMGATKQTRRKM